jgi:hypothetical protein
MRERHDRAWWTATVADWERSGLTAARYSADRGVHESTLRWWRTRLRRLPSPQSPSLALLRVEVPSSMIEPATLTALVGAAELRIAVGTDADYIGAVVAAIARAAARC